MARKRTLSQNFADFVYVWSLYRLFLHVFGDWADEHSENKYLNSMAKHLNKMSMSEAWLAEIVIKNFIP